MTNKSPKSSYSSNSLILVDTDDTILNCSDVLQEYLAKEHGMHSEVSLKDHHNIPKLYNISMERTLELVADFHRSSYFGRMEPLPCAAVVLPELHRAGFEFVTITACIDEPEVVQARCRNLREMFGFDFKAVHCIGIIPSKTEHLKLYPKSIWVDDLAHHASAGAEIGHRSFLIDKPYNLDKDTHPDVIRVRDWHEIINLK